MTEGRIPLKLTDCYHCVGLGWAAILTMLHLELTAVCPEYEALQVKEKFGSLRAYIGTPRLSGINPQEATIQALAYALEHKYEAFSGHICEYCGQPGENKQDRHSWYKTLCEEHRRRWDEDEEHRRRWDEEGSTCGHGE